MEIKNHEDKVMINVTRGLRDLIKINAVYRRKSMLKYLEDLVVADLKMNNLDEYATGQRTDEVA